MRRHQMKPWPQPTNRTPTACADCSSSDVTAGRRRPLPPSLPCRPPHPTTHGHQDLQAHRLLQNPASPISRDCRRRCRRRRYPRISHDFRRRCCRRFQVHHRHRPHHRHHLHIRHGRRGTLPFCPRRGSLARRLGTLRTDPVCRLSHCCPSPRRHRRDRRARHPCTHPSTLTRLLGRRTRRPTHRAGRRTTHGRRGCLRASYGRRELRSGHGRLPRRRRTGTPATRRRRRPRRPSFPAARRRTPTGSCTRRRRRRLRFRTSRPGWILRLPRRFSRRRRVYLPRRMRRRRRTRHARTPRRST